MPVNPMTAAPVCHICHVTSSYKCHGSALDSCACLHYSNDNQEVGHLFNNVSYAWSSGADRCQSIIQVAEHVKQTRTLCLRDHQCSMKRAQPAEAMVLRYSKARQSAVACGVCDLCCTATRETLWRVSLNLSTLHCCCSALSRPLSGDAGCAVTVTCTASRMLHFVCNYMHSSDRHRRTSPLPQ